MGEPMPMPTSEPLPPKKNRKEKILLGVLIVLFVAGVTAWTALVEGCSAKVKEGVGLLDILRSPESWQEVFQRIKPVDGSTLHASFGDYDDPSKHPSMGETVVVRGRVHFVDVSDPERPTMIFTSSHGRVRFVFHARRLERVSKLETGTEVVIGGLLKRLADGVPEVVHSQFEDEWLRK